MWVYLHSFGCCCLPNMPTSAKFRENIKIKLTAVLTLRDYIKMSRRTRPSTATSTCPLVDHPTTSGNVVRADRERDGSIRSERTMESPRRICIGVRRVVVTEEQRYGPRWLRVNDDDDDVLLHCEDICDKIIKLRT